MNIDFSALKNIDPSDVSRWPLALRVAAIVTASIVVLAAGIWFDTTNQYDILDAATKKEAELKQTFKIKQHKASNLPAYIEQMEEMKKSFGAMLRQLPSNTEVAELLLDISQTGMQAGLEFELFKPEQEVPAEFYAELPIKIKVSGHYHEFGKFVSDIASLSRIVTLHDFKIEPAPAGTPNKNGAKNLLIMSLTAKTYRYLDENEIQGQ